MAAAPARVGVVIMLAVEIAAFAVLLGPLDVRNKPVWLMIVTIPVFVAAIWFLSRSRMAPRHAAVLVMAGTAVLQIVAMSHGPTTSNDDQRYVWDAKVQLAGIDPYRYTPVDPHLARLRQPSLFGSPSECAHPMPAGCVHINHPNVHTIYPPVAEGAFVLVRVASSGWRGGHHGQFPLQLAAVLGVLATAALLCGRALRRGSAVWPAALWGWCPVVVSEFGNNAHIDWLAALFSVLALMASGARRSWAAGGLIGAAIATKLYPAVLLPALLRRRPRVVLGTAAGLVALSYLPHVLAVGTAVLGYLPGYLHDEGYASGGRLELLAEVFPHPLDTVVGAALLAIVAILAWRYTDPDAPERSAVVLFGVALLVTTPSYGWYAAVLIAVVAMSGAWEWLPVAVAPTFCYLVRIDFRQHGPTNTAMYFIGGLATLALALLRRPDSLRQCRRFVLSTTGRLRSSRSPVRH